MNQEVAKNSKEEVRRALKRIKSGKALSLGDMSTLPNTSIPPILRTKEMCRVVTTTGE